MWNDLCRCGMISVDVEWFKINYYLLQCSKLLTCVKMCTLKLLRIHVHILSPSIYICIFLLYKVLPWKGTDHMQVSNKQCKRIYSGYDYHDQYHIYVSGLTGFETPTHPTPRQTTLPNRSVQGVLKPNFVRPHCDYYRLGAVQVAQPTIWYLPR